MKKKLYHQTYSHSAKANSWSNVYWFVCYFLSKTNKIVGLQTHNRERSGYLACLVEKIALNRLF